MPPKEVDLGWDKLNHLSAFGTLAWVACLCFHPRLPRWGGVLLGLTLYGAAIECLQYFVPGRSAEWSDLLADVLGIGLGELLAAGLVALGRPQTASHEHCAADSSNEDQAIAG